MTPARPHSLRILEAIEQRSHQLLWAIALHLRKMNPASPWTKDTNTSSHRPQWTRLDTLGQELAIIERDTEASPSYEWWVLVADREDTPGPVGQETTLKQAQQRADAELARLGWRPL